MSEGALRADAARNRTRILAAASEVFAESGAQLSVDDVARRAGVGHATVFRRFPTKEDLVLALVEERLGDMRAAAEEGERADDPWEGLRTAMERIVALQVRDRGLFEVVSACEVIGSPRLREPRHALQAVLARLLHRGQEAGVVRDDLAAADLMFLVAAAGHSSPCRIDLGEVWRRYLGVIMDGMRPAGATPLAPPPPTLAELDRALESGGCRTGG